MKNSEQVNVPPRIRKKLQFAGCRNNIRDRDIAKKKKKSDSVGLQLEIDQVWARTWTPRLSRIRVRPSEI